eukprot:UN20582
MDCEAKEEESIDDIVDQMSKLSSFDSYLRSEDFKIEENTLVRPSNPRRRSSRKTSLKPNGGCGFKKASVLVPKIEAKIEKLN